MSVDFLKSLNNGQNEDIIKSVSDGAREVLPEAVDTLALMKETDLSLLTDEQKQVFEKAKIRFEQTTEQLRKLIKPL